MGTWGTAIFSDDLASDIREDFKEIIGEGKSPEEATEILINQYKSEIDDYDSGSVFWLSLAATQWQNGRLLENVKERALEIINQSIDLRRWQDNSKDLEKRRKVLQKLKDQLLSPQPLPKKISKRFKDSTTFEIGDIFSYKTISGNFILLRVIGHHQDKGGRFPICELLDWLGKEIPTMKTVNKIGTKGQMMIGSISKKDFPEDRVKVIYKSNSFIHLLKDSILRKKVAGYSAYLWRYMDKQLKGNYNIE